MDNTDVTVRNSTKVASIIPAILRNDNIVTILFVKNTNSEPKTC